MPVDLIQGFFLMDGEANTIALRNGSRFNSEDGFRVAREFNKWTKSKLRLYYVSYHNTFLLGVAVGHIESSLLSTKSEPITRPTDESYLNSELNLVFKEINGHVDVGIVTLHLYSY